MLTITNVSATPLAVMLDRTTIEVAAGGDASFPDTPKAREDAARFVTLGYIEISSQDPLENIGDLDVPASVLIAGTGLPVVLTEATGTLTVSGTPVADETFAVDGTTFTFKASASLDTEVTISADNTIQAASIASVVTAKLTTVDATSELGVVTLTAVTPGTAGNSIALAESATGVAKSGTALSGGTDGGETITVNDVVFEWVDDVDEVSDAEYVPVLIGANIALALANLKTAINANATLNTAHIKAQGLITIAASTDARLVVRGLDETAVVISEASTNITRTNITAVDRSAGKPVLFSATAAGSTLVLDTGLTSIDSFILQVRTSAGAIKAIDSTTFVGGGLIFVNAAGDADLASGDVVTVFAIGG